MLWTVQDQIRKCLDRAAEARSRAAETSDLAQKAEHFRLERSWVRLAHSYEFMASLETFLLSAGPAKAAIWHHRLVEAYNSLAIEHAHEERDDHRTASLKRHGPFEVRLVEGP